MKPAQSHDRPEVSALETLLRFWEMRTVDAAAIAFWISIASFLVSTAFELGTVGAIIGMAGTSACGFSWLFARALFQKDAGQELWPLILVGGLIAIRLPLDLFGGTLHGPGLIATGLAMAATLHALLSSTVLLLAFVEAWRGYRSDLPPAERRFRLTFASAYGSLVIIAVIWLNNTPEGSLASRSGDMIRMLAASVAVMLTLWAWRFRKRHPHPSRKRQPRRFEAHSAEGIELGQRILTLLQEQRIYLEPELKLADLAERLNEPDHKARNAITGALGFRNFNAMVNQFRIQAAKVLLEDVETRNTSILSIALDCGFSSIGPFNRAFKLETGQTPSAYRKERVVTCAGTTP